MAFHDKRCQGNTCDDGGPNCACCDCTERVAAIVEAAKKHYSPSCDCPGMGDCLRASGEIE